MHPRHSQDLVPFFIIVCLGIAYGLTLAPGISWANWGVDGGDLITAAATGGVPHPTGYPLFLILAGLFQKLPIGNLAFRTNLMSAGCSLAADLLVYFTGRRLFSEAAHPEIPACVASLAFGLSPLVWSQAVITEVYALQALLTVSLLYQALFPMAGKAANYWRGLLLGLALGNHITSLFLIPLLFWKENVFSIRPFRRLVECVIGLCVGLLIYLILPLRATHAPVINWNNPTSIVSLYQLVSGQIYHAYFSFGFLVDRARGWIGLLLKQFYFIGFAIGLFGLLEYWKKIKQTFLLLWIFIVYGVFALVYSSYDSYVYLIPTVLVFSFWLGKGVQSVLQFTILRRRWAFVILCSLLIAAIIFQIVTVGKKVDASKDNRADYFGRQVLSTAPMDGILFASGDQAIFTLWYFHFALHERTDLIVIASDLLIYKWYRENLRVAYPALILQEPFHDPLDIAAANPFRPVCYVQSNVHDEISCR